MIEPLFQRYADRLEHYCRVAPYNWFNFYDFWR
jgi:predicted LPLAT superfamily acyltransferase